MPTKAPVSRPWVLILGGLVVATFLGVAATPRFFAQYMVVSQSDAASRILGGEKTLRPDIESAAQAYDRAISWQPHNTSLLTVRGRLAMRLSELPEVGPVERVDQYKSAAAYFARSVAAAPDYQYGWCLLAYAEQRAGAAPERVARILEFSYLVGPYESSCMALRATAGLAVWPYLSPSGQSAVQLDLKNLWANPPLRLFLIDIYLALDPSGRTIVRRAALTTAQDTRFFDRRILKIMGLSPTQKK